MIQIAKRRRSTRVPVASDQDVDAKVKLSAPNEKGMFDVTAYQVRVLHRDAGPSVAGRARGEVGGWRSGVDD